MSEHKHLKEIDELPRTVIYDDDEQVFKIERDTSKTLAKMAAAHKKQLAIPRTSAFSRQDVIDAFQDSFELIGGVPRLAIWAHDNPDKFYQLYAKLLPSSAQKKVTHDGRVVVEHALAPGPLDGPQPKTIEGEVVDGSD